MAQDKKIMESIFSAVEEINRLLPEERQLKKSADTLLLGKGANLDSLGLVNFIVTVEQNIEEQLGRSITLADERAMSQTTSPFRNIGTLSEYIGLLLEEKRDG
jgi:acyl carrier protein